MINQVVNQNQATTENQVEPMLNDDGSFISTYHNLPKHAIDRYHLFHDTVDNNLYPNLHKIRPWINNYPTRFNQLTPTMIKSDDKKK